MEPTQILLFIATSLLVIVIPGQDLVLVMSRGLSGGARLGVLTAAGVSSGLLGHTLLTALGVGALLMSSDTFFIALKLLGAAYLTWLGFSLLRASDTPVQVHRADGLSGTRAFMTGATSNLSNPKITVFYFAYLPQFVSTDATSPALVLFALGAGFALLTFIVKAPIGLLAGAAADWLRNHPLVMRGINAASGFTLVALGARLAFAERD